MISDLLLMMGKKSFSPLSLSPALWLKADAGLVTDGAAQFTAANSESLSRASNASLQTGDIDFTFAGWVKRDSIVAFDMLLSKGTPVSGGGEYDLFFSSVSNTITFRIRKADDSGPVSVVSAAISLGTWTFVEVYHDSALNETAIRINNGTAVTASVPAGLVVGADDLRLGSSSAVNFLNGALDSWGFWKRLLTTGERASIYNAGAGKTYNDLTTAEKVSLVSWWNLNELSGQRNDAHGTNHLTDNNTVTFAAGVASGSATADGDPITTWQDQSGNGRHVAQATASKRPTLKLAIQNGRNGVRFDGVDDILLSAISALPTGNSSITLVVVAKTSTTGKTAMHYGGTTLRLGPHIKPLTANTAFTAGTMTDDLAVTTSNLLGVCSVYFYRYTAGTLLLEGFVPSDGNATNSQTLGGTPNWGTGAVAIGGFNNNSGFFNGDIFEVLATPSVLTDGEKLSLANSLRTKWGTL